MCVSKPPSFNDFYKMSWRSDFKKQVAIFDQEKLGFAKYADVYHLSIVLSIVG